MPDDIPPTLDDDTYWRLVLTKLNVLGGGVVIPAELSEPIYRTLVLQGLNNLIL